VEVSLSAVLVSGTRRSEAAKRIRQFRRYRIARYEPRRGQQETRGMKAYLDVPSLESSSDEGPSARGGGGERESERDEREKRVSRVSSTWLSTLAR
jgi:hypothetical protein